MNALNERLVGQYAVAANVYVEAYSQIQAFASMPTANANKVWASAATLNSTPDVYTGYNAVYSTTVNIEDSSDVGPTSTPVYSTAIDLGTQTSGYTDSNQVYAQAVDMPTSAYMDGAEAPIYGAGSIIEESVQMYTVSNQTYATATEMAEQVYSDDLPEIIKHSLIIAGQARSDVVTSAGVVKDSDLQTIEATSQMIADAVPVRDAGVVDSIDGISDVEVSPGTIYRTTVGHGYTLNNALNGRLNNTFSVAGPIIVDKGIPSFPTVTAKPSVTRHGGTQPIENIVDVGVSVPLSNNNIYGAEKVVDVGLNGPVVLFECKPRLWRTGPCCCPVFP